MRIVNLISFLLILFNIGCAQTESLNQKVYSFLVEAFPSKDTLYEGDLIFLKNTKIESIETPIITSKCGLHIFKSTLETSYPEYQYLQILISIDINGNFKIANSPTYDDKHENFNSNFKNIILENDTLKMNFVTEIGKIYQQITYAGHIRNMKKNDEIWTVELWQNDLKWRIIKVKFDANKVENVMLENPYENNN